MKKIYLSPCSTVLELVNRDSLLLIASPGATGSNLGTGGGKDYDPGLGAIEAPAFQSSFEEGKGETPFSKSSF